MGRSRAGQKAQTSGRTAPAWPRAGRRGLLFLLFASTAVERRRLEAWIDAERPARSARPDVVFAHDPAQLAERLATAAGETVVVPLGVAWLPPEQDRSRTAHWQDLLGVRGSGRPWAVLQGRILQREPDRCRVIMGAPAPVSDLRRRWLRSGWTEAGGTGLARFVVRQGELALDRAERDLVGSRYKMPSRVREEIRRSRAFWTGVATLSDAAERWAAEVAEEALGYLDEMMTRQSRLGVDLFAQLERWFLRSYRLELQPKDLAHLRELNRRHSLVFLPSHRSYLDPMVLGRLLREQGFPPNHILGGINLDFWPVGPLARRAGVVFIRRSFRDNEVYKFALRRYLCYLVEKRFNLEWYLEGGRSRTGKLRPPRFGLFVYLVEEFRQSPVEDVMLVPVSIVYDQLHEAGEMAREARGAAKRKENVRMLVGYARAQGRPFGTIHVRIAEPLSLREALKEAGDRRLEVEKVVLEVCHRIDEVTPITPTSLVTLALLGVGSQALTVSEIRDVLDPLLDYVDRRRLLLTEPSLLRQEAGVQRTLDGLVLHGVLRRSVEETEPVYAIGRDQHLVAAFYRNGAIHFFVNRAVGELAVARLAEAEFPDPMAEAWAEALRLRDLLKFEFFFPRRKKYADQLRKELEMLNPEERGEELASALTRSRLHLAHRVLSSFLEAYSVAADRLAARDPAAPIDEKEFVAECLAAGRQYLAQRRIHSPESVSSELFGNALKLAANRGLTTPGGEDVAERRRAFAAELSTIIRRLETIRELAMRDLRLAAGARAAPAAATGVEEGEQR